MIKKFCIAVTIALGSQNLISMESSILVSQEEMIGAHYLSILGNKFNSFNNRQLANKEDSVVKAPVYPPIQTTGIVPLSMAFSSNGEELITGNFDVTLKVWDVKKRIEIVSIPVVFEGGGAVSNPRIITKDMLGSIVSASSGIFLLSPETKKQIGILPKQDEGVFMFESSPDGSLIFSRESTGAYLWDVKNRQRTHTFKSPTFPQGACLAISDNNNYFAAGDGQSQIYVWQKDNTSQPSATLLAEGLYPLTIKLNNAGTQLLAAGYVAEGNNRFSFPVKVYDPQTGKHLGDCTGHQGLVYNACFSSDGRTINSVSDDGYQITWDAKTFAYINSTKMAASFKGDFISLVVSPDNYAQGGANSGYLYLEPIDTKKNEAYELESEKIEGNRGRSLALVPWNCLLS